MTAIWAQYARYNRLANEKLYEACAVLSEEERRRDLGAFFKSVHGTLNHLVLGDRIWMTRFEGGSHPSTDLGAILFDDVAALTAARADMEPAAWLPGALLLLGRRGPSPRALRAFQRTPCAPSRSGAPIRALNSACRCA